MTAPVPRAVPVRPGLDLDLREAGTSGSPLQLPSARPAYGSIRPSAAPTAA
ncbi:hypothetical protein AB0N07_48345 [Streptomyces sp. NPDC051172]|uniref:hypothetical protein n=1 Tax=Streptomyces sp. NPDC051172 TaxID=3155796 RepID=UPI0034423C6F